MNDWRIRLGIFFGSGCNLSLLFWINFQAEELNKKKVNSIEAIFSTAQNKISIKFR